MESKNKLNQVPLADLKEDELTKLKDLEKSLQEKYYLIAFEK
ncbi:hypothetical protein [Senegalia massiliensis]|nr:hypothetical protein [Senegalia massiliensis]